MSGPMSFNAKFESSKEHLTVQKNVLKLEPWKKKKRLEVQKTIWKIEIQSENSKVRHFKSEYLKKKKKV